MERSVNWGVGTLFWALNRTGEAVRQIEHHGNVVHWRVIGGQRRGVNDHYRDPYAVLGQSANDDGSSGTGMLPSKVSVEVSSPASVRPSVCAERHERYDRRACNGRIVGRGTLSGEHRPRSSVVDHAQAMGRETDSSLEVRIDRWSRYSSRPQRSRTRKSGLRDGPSRQHYDVWQFTDAV